MESNFSEPINIGSDEMVTINELVERIAQIAQKKINKNYIEGPQGVRGRNSDNALINKMLNWAPSNSLNLGLEKTYFWILSQL